MRFARNVHFQIKDGKEQEFNRLFDNEVLPMLKSQKGFREELTLISKDNALGISVWDDRQSAENYHKNTYPRIIEKLNPVITGTPTIENYDVAAATMLS